MTRSTVANVVQIPGTRQNASMAGNATPPSTKCEPIAYPQAFPRSVNDRTMPPPMVKVVSQARFTTVGGNPPL